MMSETNPDLDGEKKIQELADALFEAVQEPQGYAFVSDGETAETVSSFFDKLRWRLAMNNEAGRRMRAFLRKHKEPVR